MRPTVQLAVLFGMLTPLSFAETWSGHLVDAKCYTTEEQNKNPSTTLEDVNRDRVEEIRACPPKPNSKAFTIVQFDGQKLDLSPAGNAKVTEFVRNTGKQHFYHVTITGEMNGKEIRVDSIAASPVQ
jgi:hypothetical protein